MERKPGKTKKATSILSLPSRAMAVWLLGKLSLLLVIVLLALPALFALELIVEARRAERDRITEVADLPASPPTAEISKDSLLLAGHVQPDLSATPADLPSSAATSSPTPPGEVAVGSTGRAATATPNTVQAAGAVALPATATLTPIPSAVQPALVRPAITPSPTVTSSPTSTPDPGAMPVQIRIPAIKVKRSIVELPQIRDPRTGAWTQDLDLLFRKSRKDLVGHYAQSAQPGQEGNTILVGHNYGYGYKGVFLKLGRLKRGKKIFVVNAAGQTFTYEVTAIEKVPWRRKNAKELVQHAKLLAASGPERLTLVTCGGANVQPFPVRIYVVAEPVRD